MILIGVEVGQRHSPSAICLAESCLRKVDGRKEFHFLVRSLERLPGGTTFPEVADRLAATVAAVRQLAPKANPALYVNLTCLGAPLLQLLRSRVPLRIRPVTFTRGDRRIEAWPAVELGKAFLVSRLQILLQTRRVHLPRTPEAEILAEELLHYEIRIEPDANDRYGSFRVGSQDDLLMALGLAVQTDVPHPPLCQHR